MEGLRGPICSRLGKLGVPGEAGVSKTGRPTPLESPYTAYQICR